jgi:tRNA 2-thiouridine synthesizing protein A
MRLPDDHATPVALELDCRDLRCPLPIIELGVHIADVEIGEVIAVVTRDGAALYDVPAWCHLTGNEYLGEDDAADGVTRYLVRRNGATAEAASPS